MVVEAARSHIPSFALEPSHCNTPPPRIVLRTVGIVLLDGAYNGTAAVVVLIIVSVVIFVGYISLMLWRRSRLQHLAEMRIITTPK